MTNELISTTNPAGTQINNDVFLCVRSVTFLHVSCLSKTTNITICCNNHNNFCSLLLHGFSNR